MQRVATATFILFSTLACAKAREGTVFSGSGTFVSANSIEWENIWGTDAVTLTSEAMTLKGRFGEFKHHRASRPMSPACLPMRQRDGEAAWKAHDV
jgi:hypothetical protein